MPLRNVVVGCTIRPEGVVAGPRLGTMLREARLMGWLEVPRSGRLLLLTTVFAALLVTPAAATSLPSTITTNTTLTAAGSPWTSSGTVTVQSGVTLTVEAGAEVNVWRLGVDGTLDVNGTAQNPALFTSAQDSAPAQWSGIELRSDSSTIDHAEVRYANNGLTVWGAFDPSITNSLIHDNWNRGIYLEGGGDATVSGNNVHSNGGEGIYINAGGSPDIGSNTVTGNVTGGIYYRAPGTTNAGVVKIHDNTVEANDGQAAIRVWSTTTPNISGGTLEGNQVHDNTGRAIEFFVPQYDPIPPDLLNNPVPTGNGSDAIWVGGKVGVNTTWADPGYPIVFMGGYNLNVPSGVTLTLEPGLILKGDSGSAQILVDGTLNAVGTTTEPVYFTGLRNDAIGGDTNGDGDATLPFRGEWAWVYYRTGSSGTLDRIHASYGGSSYAMINVACCAGSKTVKRSLLTNANSAAVYVSGDPTAGQSMPNVSWNTYRGNVMAVDKAGLQTLHSPHGDYGCPSGPAPMGCGDGTGAKVDEAPIRSAAGDRETCGSPAGPTGLDGPIGVKRRPQKSACGGDPVSLLTGAFTYSNTDLRLSNKSDTDLVFTRSYGSDDSTDAGLGPGWSHSGLMAVSELENGDVRVRSSSGQHDTFTDTPTGFESPDGVHESLVQNPNGTYTLSSPAGTSYAFRADGRLSTATDDHGLVTTWGYDSNGRLSTITDPSGQTLTFTHNASNHITKVTDSTGREVSFTYSPAGDLQTVTDAMSGVTTYGYDGQHRLTTITDPRSNVILTNTYDSQGRVTEQLDGENNLWDLDYATNQTTVTRPEGGETTYVFDSQKRISSETDPNGHTTSYTYDAAGNVETITRPGGAVWQLDHDARGNLISAIDPELGERTYTYDSENHLTSYTDPRNKSWTYTWTGDDLTATEDPDLETTTLTHNAAGQPLTITDPNSHTRTLTYDSRGNLTSDTNGESETTSYGYNSRNYLTSKTEPGTPAEAYTRSALGELLSLTTPEGHLTSFEYDANGHVVEVTDPALEVWTIERDKMERPTAYVDPLLQRTEIAYDGDQRLISLSDRRGKITSFDYDPAGQLIGIHFPEGGDWTMDYDGRGNRVEMIDPRLNTTTYEYDLMDRMTEANEPLMTTTTYAYDDGGNLTSVTDPEAHTTGFVYDDLGRLTEINQPLSKQTSFTYDQVGNPVTRTTAAGTLDYSYDAADRLVEIAQGATPLRTFGYDNAGRLILATANADTLTIGYDDDSQVTALDDDRGQTATLGYDSRGNLTSQTDGRGTVAYGYDDLSRMTSLTDPQSGAFAFDYDPEGNLTEAELPNGVVTTRAYDDDGRLTAIDSVLGSTALESFDYGYDAAGNRTSMTDRLAQQTTYTYDTLNRLTNFDPPGTGSTSYGYDDAGNRTAAGGTTYSFNALNQLTSDSAGTTYDYDDAGRLIETADGSQTTTFEYDLLDQLTEVDDGTTAGSYAYDALGRRASRTVGSTTTENHYGDRTDRPILESGASGIIESYVQGPLGLVEERSGGTTSYPLADSHGDVTVTTNGSGAVISRQTWDPWGQQLSGPELEYGYLGAYQRLTDSSTDLMQMGVRAYHPSTGRFLSEDPLLGYVGSGITANRYPYAWDSPIDVYDLTGLSPCIAGFIACDEADDPCDSWTSGPLILLCEVPEEDADEWRDTSAAIGDATLQNFPIVGIPMDILGMDPGPWARDRMGTYVNESSSEYVNARGATEVGYAAYQAYEIYKWISGPPQVPPRSLPFRPDPPRDLDPMP
jgi:RHS repeat-associated protein